MRAVADQRSSWDSLTVLDVDGQALHIDQFDSTAALDAFDLPTTAGPLASASARPEGSTDVASIIDLTELARRGGVWDAPTTVRALDSWTTVDSAYSGSARYETTIALDAAELAGRHWLLELGEVRDVAEIAVNGAAIGSRLWPPYRADVTAALRPGDNVVRVRVTNTGANSHGQALPSGLIGPVFLRPEQLVDLPLTLVPGQPT